MVDNTKILNPIGNIFILNYTLYLTLPSIYPTNQPIILSGKLLFAMLLCKYIPNLTPLRKCVNFIYNAVILTAQNLAKELTDNICLILCI